MRPFQAGAARRGRGDGGAAAVEFALVVPILVGLLFGIIDYGMWFADSISLRQGVREAARAGVVGTFAADACPTASADLEQLACATKAGIPAISGDLAVKIAIPGGWVRGQRLTVCVMQRHDSLTGLVPLPSDGLIVSRVDMAIEDDTISPIPTGGWTDAPPEGASWSPWC